MKWRGYYIWWGFAAFWLVAWGLAIANGKDGASEGAMFFASYALIRIERMEERK